MEQVQLTFNFENNQAAAAFLAKVEGNESTAGRAPRGTGTRSTGGTDIEDTESETRSSNTRGCSGGGKRTDERASTRGTKSRDEDFDLGFEDDADEEEETQYSFEDIADAFKAYAAKYSREKAQKVLAKFKVKSIKDLSEDQYADAMELVQK